MKQDTSEERHAAGLYEIRIKGFLDNRWTDWFDGLSITQESNGESRLTGPVIDQAALHSLLRKVRDLGMTLVSVNQVHPGQGDSVHRRSEEESAQ